jgi:hypothetical protein
MPTQLARLTAFREGYARQCQKLAGVQNKPWTSETILELARVYGVEPFKDMYPVAPNDGRCPHCRAEVRSAPVAPVAGIYADRSVCSCRKCSARFVRLAK